MPDVALKPEPEVHLLGYEDFGMSYAIKFWITDFARKYPIMAAVGKNIWYRFKRQGIEIPVPLKDQLKETLGNIPAWPDHKALTVREDRLSPHSLYSSLLRYQSGEKRRKCLVPEDEIRSLAKTVSCQRYASGEVLFRQGEKGDSCFVVISGSFKGEIAYQEKGKKYTSEFKVEPFGIFGEMSLFTDAPDRYRYYRIQSRLLEIIPGFRGTSGTKSTGGDVIADLVSRRNQENQAFLEKIKELSAQDIKASTNEHSVLARLKSLIQRNV